jgi:hypothetical protein
MVRPIVPIVPGSRLRQVGCAVALGAFFLSMLANRAREATGTLLFGVAGDLLMVVVFLAFAAWIIGSLRMRKARS